MAKSSRAVGRPALLVISASFAPETTPTAIRAGKLLSRLARDWDIDVLTASAGPDPRGDELRVETIGDRRPRRLLAALGRLRMNKLIELLVWPDSSIFWVLPAIRAGRRMIAERRPEAIVVFMMPYGAGLAGLALGRLCRLPLIVNLDDSPTCTDMHPHFPTRLHYLLARRLEDAYVRRADAVVYVSARNLERVRARQPTAARSKLHLIRYGADAGELPRPSATEHFEIVYTGAMTGWWSLLDGGGRRGLTERLYGAWMRLGRHQLVELDHRTSSPAVIGRAILAVLSRRAEWAGKLHLTIYGNPYPEALVRQALEATGVQSVVSVLGPIPHRQVAAATAAADLLFLTLPARLDGSPGGRISAKTYEYLTTDRPILAATPAGENREYLQGRPGVWLLDPADEQGMARVIEELAAAKFAGTPRSFDRAELRGELSYDTRAREFEAVVREAIGGDPTRPKGRSPRA